MSVEPIISRQETWQLYANMQKENVPCNICGSFDFAQLSDRDRYDMGIITVMCKRCGFIFTNPRPTQEEMDKFYKDAYRNIYGRTDPNKNYKRNPENGNGL